MSERDFETRTAFLFSGLKLPQPLPAAPGANNCAVSIISTMWPSIARTSASKCGVSGVSHRPYTRAAFSLVTGSPAMYKVRIVLLAYAAAVDVSANHRISSSRIVILILRTLLAVIFCRESGKDGKL